MRKLIKKISTWVMVVVMATATTCSTVSAAPEKQVDLKGTYHASMGIQTATTLWAQRMAYYEESQNAYYGTKDGDKLISKDGGEEKIHEGVFTDVEIAGNGTYCVKLEDADFLGETCISQLHIATDIPLNDTIKFTDVTATINSREILHFEEGYMEEEEPYLQGGMVVLLLNHWRENLIQEVTRQGKSEDASNGYNLLNGTGKESVEIQFTVSGFEYDNPAAVKETSMPAKESSQAAEGNGDVPEKSMPVEGKVAIVVLGVLVLGGGVFVYRKIRK